MTLSALSLQGTTLLTKVSPTLSASEDGLRERVLAAVALVLFGKGQDPLSTGIELQVAVPGLKPELGSPSFVKLGHPLLWAWKGAQGRKKVTRDTF